MKTNSQLRAAARAALGGKKLSSTWLGAVGAYIITVLITGMTSYFCVGYLLLFPLMVGLFAYHLALVRTGKGNLNELFACFRRYRFFRSIRLYLLMYLYLLLWLIVPLAPLVKLYSYRLAPYVMLDRPELSANRCITESRRLMHGHKRQMLMLDLSFLWRYLVGVLACYFGTLLVVPYQQAALAAFYEEVRAVGEQIDASAEAAATVAAGGDPAYRLP